VAGSRTRAIAAAVARMSASLRGYDEMVACRSRRSPSLGAPKAQGSSGMPTFKITAATRELNLGREAKQCDLHKDIYRNAVHPDSDYNVTVVGWDDLLHRYVSAAAYRLHSLCSSVALAHTRLFRLIPIAGEKSLP
jgi:hypothetical protein